MHPYLSQLVAAERRQEHLDAARAWQRARRERPARRRFTRRLTWARPRPRVTRPAAL